MDDVFGLAELIAQARRILVFTGAGISTGSGIADYRGPQGLWHTREPVYFNDFLASQDARVEYWSQKLETWPTIRDAEPNAAHRAIVRIEHAGRLLLVITQNIDGLHEAAGTSRDLLVELHGTNRWVECLDCGALSDPQNHFDAFAACRVPPTCDSCGGWLKPATISFGQQLRQDDLNRSFAAAQTCDLVIAAGSSLTVQPAASVPLMAVENQAHYAIVNRGRTEHDDIVGLTMRIDGDVAEVLPRAIDIALSG